VNYNIFRWYRPGWGRYTQSDPLLIGSAQLTIGTFDGAAATALYQWQPQHQNAYGYGLTNPLRYHDPTGELSLACAYQQAPPAEAKAVQYALTPSFPGGTKGLHNGPADAFRHCYWSCLMVENCGWDTAYAAGTGHEVYDKNAKRRWFPNDPAESAMDLANNYAGRQCGGRFGGACDTCCLRKLYSGELQDRLPW
jgi:hypothetical protein